MVNRWVWAWRRCLVKLREREVSAEGDEATRYHHCTESLSLSGEFHRDTYHRTSQREGRAESLQKRA